LNVRILSDELSTVSDWYQLGIKLGVPDYKLDEIQMSYPTEGCSRWKVKALSLWLRCTPNSSWRNVVRALQQMGENALAERMQQKYIRRRSSPTFSHNSTPHVVSPTLQAASVNPLPTHQILQIHSGKMVVSCGCADEIITEIQKIGIKPLELLRELCKVLLISLRY